MFQRKSNSYFAMLHPMLMQAWQYILQANEWVNKYRIQKRDVKSSRYELAELIFRICLPKCKTLLNNLWQLAYHHQRRLVVGTTIYACPLCSLRYIFSPPVSSETDLFYHWYHMEPFCYKCRPPAMAVFLRYHSFHNCSYGSWALISF